MPSNPHYEIERKFVMTGKPDLPVLEQHVVRQAYFYVNDDVEVRLIARYDADTYDTLYPCINKAKLTIKNGNGLVRKETEIHLSSEQLRTLVQGLPSGMFITKYFTIFDLGNGLTFEFSSVDPNLETGFMYGEIEFPCVEAADEYQLPEVLAKCVDGEVTDEVAYQMKNYWRRTRMGE